MVVQQEYWLGRTPLDQAEIKMRDAFVSVKFKNRTVSAAAALTKLLATGWGFGDEITYLPLDGAVGDWRRIPLALHEDFWAEFNQRQINKEVNAVLLFRATDDAGLNCLFYPSEALFSITINRKCIGDDGLLDAGYYVAAIVAPLMQIISEWTISETV